MATTIVPVARLPVFETVMRTCDLLAKHFVRGIVYYILLVLVIAGLTIVAFYYIGEPNFERNPPPPPDEWLPFVLVALSTIIPQTAYFVGIVRLGANDRVDRNHLLGLRWWGRETCVLLRTLLLGLVLALISLPGVLIFSLIVIVAGSTLGREASVFLSVLPFILVIFLFYFLARFNLYVVSPALDEKLGLGRSWQLTRGNGWRLFFIGFLLYLPFIVGNLAIEYALNLKGTLTYAIASSVLTVLGILVAGLGSAIVYRAFVPAQVAQAVNATSAVAAR